MILALSSCHKNCYFSPANGSIATKHSHKGPRKGLHPGCSQGHSQCQRTPPNLPPKSPRFSPWPQTRLESSYENFPPYRIFSGYRPLANGEESVRISARSPELGEPKHGYKFRGLRQKNLRQINPYFCQGTPFGMQFGCAKPISQKLLLARDIGEKPKFLAKKCQF